MLFFYKDFSRPAGRVLKTAVKLAGEQGAERAHTGHLLLALLQKRSAAAEFLQHRNISESAVRQLMLQEGTNRPRRLKAKECRPSGQFCTQSAVCPVFLFFGYRKSRRNLL